ncbi:hypothetical protein HN512_04945 [Candidatus Peregrinibacteria bacterium]|nr:hypothetical protein [Candidatus Peregrinibacteria bacterium]MBT3599153.1 hypothetical protein [Candidatus Peregrinibacteria bacterium]MBT6730793.1 hypothetical protein [Candidatus Peregrinibacteria bacterium]MBT7008875.1 hypothetical protein [Candidatus Peregrinibacteria bacterium]MBT7344620.1 hypothetical protein [Candidatus Peregrinibacteria bacterium]
MKVFLKIFRGKFLFVGVVMLSLVIGFLVTSGGVGGMDDPPRYRFSRWVLYRFHLIGDRPGLLQHQKWYGSIWDFILGINTEFIFPFLNDPYWVRIALTVALFPITLYITYRLLRRAEVPAPTAFLSIALLFSSIRFGGHALFTKDFPPACAFLIATLYLWVSFKDSQKEDKNFHFSLRTILAVTFVCLLPYLIRPPVALHVAMFFGVLLLFSIFQKKWSLRYRFFLIATPLLFSILLIYIFTPEMWKYEFFDINGWLHQYQMFSEFHVNLIERFYGRIYTTTNLPWWYAFSWMPFLMHPIGFVLSCIGIVFFIFDKNKISSIVIPIFNININLSFRRWLIFVLLSSWLAILVFHPNLYDGIRHVLFIFPLIPIVAGIGFIDVNHRIQIVMACSIILISFFSYFRFGVYSYMYIPSFYPWKVTEHFMGDDRLFCYQKAASFINENIDSNAVVSVRHEPEFRIQQYRYGSSILYKDQNRISLRFNERVSPSDSFSLSVISSRHYREMSVARKQILLGEQTLLWEDKLPSGETACIVVRRDN